MSFIVYRPVTGICSRARAIGCLNSICRKKSTEVIKEEDDVNAPVRFSTSDAGWNFELPKYNSAEYYPWYKPTILFGTMMSCVIYFMFFRPPNDIDEELSMPLGKRLLQIRESHLMMEKQKLKASGGDGKAVDQELDEIHKLRVKYKYV